MKKFRCAVSGIMLTVFTICFLAFAAPKLFGVKMFCVLSGSMEPALSAGDLVYAVPASFGEIAEGDIISFFIGNKSTVVTHRVAGIDREGCSFITKGDSNSDEDSKPAEYSNVIGVVRLSVPRIGTALQWASTPRGKTVLISAIVAVALISVLLGSADRVGSVKKKQGGGQWR